MLARHGLAQLRDVEQQGGGVHALSEGLPAEQGARELGRRRAAVFRRGDRPVLKGVPLDQLPAVTSAKWKELGLDEDYDIYPRNLSVLLNR